MTTVSQEEVEVTQADREAAAKFMDDHGWLCEEQWSDLYPGDQDVIAKAFARHRQQAERGEAWRPIEEAPKDWTDVLVFSPEHEGFNCDGVFSAFYDTDEAGWSTHGPGHSIRLHPTHWQPLPTPPEAV